MQVTHYKNILLCHNKIAMHKPFYYSCFHYVHTDINMQWHKGHMWQVGRPCSNKARSHYWYAVIIAAFIVASLSVILSVPQFLGCNYYISSRYSLAAHNACRLQLPTPFWKNGASGQVLEGNLEFIRCSDSKWNKKGTEQVSMSFIAFWCLFGP